MPFSLKKLTLATCITASAFALSGCSLSGSNKPAALQVTTVPEASVFLDGKHLGKTPFYSDQLKAGTYTLKISASEASYLTKVDLQPAALTVVNRQLASNFLNQSGETLNLVKGQKGLLLTSTPSGSTVIIDGQLAGTTPLLNLNLAEGDHKIEVSSSNYSTRQFAIKIVGGYQLQADVTLASDQAKETPQASTPVEVIKVEITQTPQGFLRVRRDASTTSPELGRVRPKEQYEVIQESDGWVKISFDGKQGWVAAQYTKKI